MRLKKFNNLIKFHLNQFILIELIHKLIIFTIILPFGYFLFSVILRLMNIRYITNDTFNVFIRSPYLFILIILWFVLYVFLSMFEIFGIVECFNFKNNFYIVNIFKSIINDFKRLFYKKNISYILILVIYIPITQLSLTAITLFIFQAPKFLIQYIDLNIFIILLAIFIIINIWITLPYIYIIHYYVLFNLPFKEAVIKSKEKIKKNNASTLLRFILLEMGIAVLFLLFILIIISVGYCLFTFYNQQSFIFSMILIVIKVIVRIVMLIFLCVQVPLIISLFSYQFYNGSYMNIIKVGQLKPIKVRKKYMITILNIIIFSLIAYYLNIFITAYENIFDNDTFEIMAHRGSSKQAPENSLAAFDLAIKQNCDYIEFDIQYTKDREIVVFHDTTLKRITGESLKISQLTFDELKQRDIGSYFSKQYNGEKILLFEEVIRLYKENVKFNIEIKTEIINEGIEKDVVKLINLYQIKDICIVTSMNYNVLEKIKQIDPEIKTGYVLNVAIGDFVELKDADCFSIQKSYINIDIINMAHYLDKKIYAWTVNKPKDIIEMIEMNVDGIISDYPELVNEIIHSSNHFPNLYTIICFLLS